MNVDTFPTSRHKCEILLPAHSTQGIFLMKMEIKKTFPHYNARELKSWSTDSGIEHSTTTHSSVSSRDISCENQTPNK